MPLPMESSAAAASSSSTNWCIASGSLVNSVTFESSSNDDDNTHDQSPPVDYSFNSPLILYPPSPDSSPCEITLTFSGKYEVRQVYVRSTARVYEIYCAPELGSNTEYLCTVRCGVAARDEDVLSSAGVEDVVLMHLKGLDEGKHKNVSDLTSNEDDWIEVKAHDTSVFIDRNSTLSLNLPKIPGRSSQDLYEATAEITDANPCMCITLKLLSLQDKGCVLVDEVYVFADPVDTGNLDNEVGSMENSAGSSLIAMLAPAFSQLSKTKSIGRAPDRYTINTTETQKSEEVESKAADTVDGVNKIQQGVKLQEAVGPSIKPAEVEVPQVSDIEGKLSTSPLQAGILDQLVSRVSRIEDLVLKFEESMLKPINSIDKRLQQVEQQLEVLAKKTENCGSGTRISAPAFSYSESETNSFYSGIRDLTNMPRKANKKDSRSAALSFSCEDTHVSLNAPALHAGLVIVAPEFSNCDEEEENCAVQSTKVSPKDKQNHTLPNCYSLGCTLAEYLASAEHRRQENCLTHVKAPEFQNEVDTENDKIGSPIIRSEISADPSACVSEPGETGNHAQESVKEPTKEKQKRALSVDDALASTLAGFLASVRCQKHSETHGASEFLNEENNEGKADSQRGHSEMTVDHSTCINEANGMEHMRNSFSSLSNASSDGIENANTVVQTDEGDDELWPSGEWVENASQGTNTDLVAARVTHDMLMTHPYRITDDVEITHAGKVIINTSALEKTDNLEQFSGDQIHDGSDTVQEAAASNGVVACTEVRKELSNQDVLQQVGEFSNSASLVDFGTPILEVKFASQESLKTRSPLEALLAGMPDFDVEVPSVEESCTNGSHPDNQCNLVSVEDWGPMVSATDGHIPVDMDYCNLIDPPLNMEGDELPDCYPPNGSPDTAAPRLI